LTTTHQTEQVHSGSACTYQQKKPSRFFNFVLTYLAQSCLKISCSFLLFRFRLIIS